MTTPAESLTGERPRFRGDIQGLRAIAVLAILLNHAGMPHISGGYVGVDVFFVISGFLITTHLAEELTSTGRIRFGRFYARRVRRILPAAFVVIALTVVAAIALQPPVLLPGTLRAAAAAALYVPNILFARQRTDYFHASDDPSILLHYWSLGVEEQFYLLWPVVLLAGFAMLGRSQRGLAVTLASVCAASFAVSVYLTARTPTWAFFLLPSRAWEFGIGGLLALAVSSSGRWSNARIVGLLGWPGLALIAYSLIGFDRQTSFPGWRAAIPIAGTALVILAGTGHSRSSPRRLLSAPPLLFVGLISYSVYLVHWPLPLLTQYVIGLEHPLPLAATLALGAAAIPLGYLMYRWVEEPWRRGHFVTAHRARRTVAIAVAVSVGLATASWAGSKVTGSRVLDAGFTVSASPFARYPGGTPMVPSNLEPSLRAARHFPNTAIYRNGCNLSRGETVPRRCEVGSNPHAPRVVLFGDSHAAQFYPALAQLAEAGDIRLNSITKSGCQGVETSGKRECSPWREQAISMINHDPPDIIVLGNFSFRVPDWPDRLPAGLARLPQQSRIVVIADTPYMGFQVPVCLSENLRAANECAKPRDEALNTQNRAAERQQGVDILDVTDYLCNQQYCPPIIGNLLVYRDHNHLTGQFATALAPLVRSQLLG